ncbi:MAG: helix-turn-helix transcriptional regulator [Clostridiales bacterium]|nr:helix-turn-helix transcriptional regulator [Clostridiales bacterium]
MLPDELLLSVAGLFKVIGDPTRTRIVLALNKRELCVSDLSTVLDMTKSAVSHQLSTLKQNKIVKSRREGVNIFYSLDDQHITDIIELALTHMKHK